MLQLFQRCSVLSLVQTPPVPLFRPTHTGVRPIVGRSPSGSRRITIWVGANVTTTLRFGVQVPASILAGPVIATCLISTHLVHSLSILTRTVIRHRKVHILSTERKKQITSMMPIANSVESSLNAKLLLSFNKSISGQLKCSVWRLNANKPSTWTESSSSRKTP